MALFACDSSGDASPTFSGSVPAPSGSVPAPDPAVDYAQKYADTVPTLDAQLNEVSLEYPGFKGIVGSDDGSEILVLSDAVVDPSRSAAQGVAPKVAGLTDALASRLGIEPSRVTLADASAKTGLTDATPLSNRPDFHVLYQAKTGLRRFLFETDLVNWLDLDDQTGRITVGIASAGDADRLRAAMTPEELALVDFVVREPFENAVATTSFYETVAASLTTSSNASSPPLRSLRDDAFRPLIAGAETEFTNPRLNLGTACTQGPAVRLGTSYGFLSNAHCTLDRTRIDQTEFYQPRKQPSDRIGTEQAEPSYRSGWFITDGYYSDAAFIKTTGGIGIRGQMTSADNCNFASCVENGIINDVLGTSSYLPVNIRVFKTGRTTGSTAGKITAVCVDRDSGNEARRSEWRATRS